ncbi:hypothetical protein [Sphingopyxis panaciterrae]
MTLFRKTAISLAAVSLIVAPVAASAASALDDARATSSDQGQSELEGNSSWLIGLLGLLAGVTAIILIADKNNDNDPVSP